MEVMVLAGGLVAVAAVLVVWLGRRRRGGDPGVSGGSYPSVWVTPPVDSPPAPGSGPIVLPGGGPGGPKQGHGLLGLEDLPAPDARRGLRPAWISLGLAGVVVAAVAVMWNAGFLSSLLSGDRASDSAPWHSAPAGAASPAMPAPETGREVVAAAAEPVMAEDAETGVRLIAWSGNGQTGLPGRPLSRALAVVVRDESDRPMPGVQVRFAVAGGGGRLEPSAAVTSDLGLAAATWWLGADPDSLRVRVYLAGSPGLHVEFEAALQNGELRRDVAVADPESDPVPDRAATESVPPAETPATAPTATPETGAATAAAGASEAAPPRPSGPPAPVSAGARPRVAITAGGVHSCRLEGGRDVICFGGDQAPATSLRPVAGAPPLRVVRAGVFHSCGLTSDGTIYCWPARASAQPTAAAPAAELTLPGGATPIDVAAGSEHSCALSSAGAVYCWGSNSNGQLGTGGSSNARSPVRVVDLPPVVQLVAGWMHTCALTREGRAYCWGANSSGQLGDGGVGDRTRPSAVEQAVGFTLITAGSAHSCGVTPTGEAWCWGSNEHGQLGTGPSAREVRPRRAATDQRFSTLSAGGVHTCGLTANGQAWCWGRNTFGQLGDGTTRSSPLPARVAGGHRLVALEAGGAHTCAEAAGGGVYCWGNNVQGQVGDGTRENRSSPVLMTREGA